MNEHPLRVGYYKGYGKEPGRFPGTKRESSGSTASAQGCAPARRRQSPGRGEGMRAHHIRVGTENSLRHRGSGAPASSVLRREAEGARGRACSTWGLSRRLGPMFSLRVHASCGAPLPNIPNSREPRVPSLFQKTGKVKAVKGLRTCFPRGLPTRCAVSSARRKEAPPPLPCFCALISF